MSLRTTLIAAAGPCPAPSLVLRRSFAEAIAPWWAGTVLAMAAWVLGDGKARDAAAARGAAPSDALHRFEDAVLPHLDDAYTLAVYLCRDRDVAEDVVQEAFLRAFRGFGSFRGGNGRAWLLAIVRNCHLTWREEMRRRATMIDPGSPAGHDDDVRDDESGAASAWDDPESLLIRQGEAEDVRSVLADLPQAAREILVLRDVEDLPYRDIAQVLDVPLGTVMSRLARARRAFARRWRGLQEGAA